MTHEFIPGTDTESGYDECAACGLLVESDLAGRITVACRFHPCDSAGNRGQACVMVQEDEEALCSYCDRPGGLADEPVAVEPWAADLEWLGPWGDDDDLTLEMDESY